MYNPDINKLASQLIMPALRKTRMLAWIRTLLFPFVYILAQFNTLRSDIAKRIRYNGQVIMLEKALNDKYDNVDRRIYIEDSNSDLPLQYAFYESENQGELGFAYFESETPADPEDEDFGFGYFYTEYDAQTHFVVNLPAIAALIDTEEKENEMRRYINQYKLAGKDYSFNEF